MQITVYGARNTKPKYIELTIGDKDANKDTLSYV